jgi:hypothetical protein
LKQHFCFALCFYEVLKRMVHLVDDFRLQG